MPPKILRKYFNALHPCYYLRDLFRPNRNLLLENMALRQQILVLERQVKRPRFKDHERAFWVLLSRYWPGWKKPLRLVQPETVISWHRKSWRLFWRWKSKSKVYGRPNVPIEVIKLIMLGYEVSQSIVVPSKYFIRRKSCRENHSFCFSSAKTWTENPKNWVARISNIMNFPVFDQTELTNPQYLVIFPRNLGSIAIMVVILALCLPKTQSFKKSHDVEHETMLGSCFRKCKWGRAMEF